MMKLKKLLSLLLGAIMLCSVMPTSYAQGEAEVDTTLIVRPTVMINAGTEKSYNPKFNYATAGHILLSPNSYSDPLTNIKAGLFLKWNLPKIPDGYEVKRSYFIGKAVHTNQFNSKDGYHIGKSYIYHLDAVLDDEYIFNSDTETYPDKNLATLLPTFSKKTHKLETTFLYKGATTNYYNEVTDDTKFYNMGFSAKNYTKNLYINSNGGPVEVNTLMASRQNLTFDASSDLDYGPLVWYIEIDKLFDAEFVSPDQVDAGKAFDTAIDVSILDKRIASVIFNVNGANYTATLSDGKWVATIPALEEGEYTVKANITDIYDSKYEETQKITVSVPPEPELDAEFVSKNYAHIGDGFGVALNVENCDVSEVSFDVNGVTYPAHLYNDNWVAYVSGINQAGTYTITASVKDADSRTAEKTQTFTVYDKATILGSTHCMKYQSSDGKMWKVSDAANYDLKYDSTVKDCLYSIINISSITNPDLIESAYFVASTGVGGRGNNNYTKFVIEECEEFTSSYFTGGKEPTSFPEIVGIAASGAYSATSVSTNDIDYNILISNIPVTANTTPRYIKLDATEYIKTKVISDAPKLCLRTSVRNADGDNYALAINNAAVKLYIKYKDSETIDNYDGTTSYVVDARDYGEDTVLSIAARVGETFLDSVDSCNTAERTLYRYVNGEENPTIFVWNNITDIVPLRAPIIVK